MLYRIDKDTEASLYNKAASALYGDSGMIEIEVTFLDTPVPVESETWLVRVRGFSNRGSHTRLDLATEDERYFRVYLDSSPLTFSIQPKHNTP